MHIVIIGKFPPIQGGVSTQTYWTAQELAKSGHDVHVVTNANEVEPGLRNFFWENDSSTLAHDYGIGSVYFHATADLHAQSFVPWANPFGSKLFGLAISIIEKYGCDLLIGWYFEPYGLTAAQVGHMYHKPVIIVHAGSDLGRLTKHPDLVKSYEWMLSEARVVLTDGRKSTGSILDHLKVSKKKRVTLRAGRIPRIYSDRSEPINISDLLPKLPEWYHTYSIPREVIEGIVRLNRKEIDYSLPIIGVYGKVGEIKGNYELLEALEFLARRGLNFNFISLSGSNAPRLEKYYRVLLKKKNLAKRTWVLPTIAPWRIPSFLNLCNIICFLEREFPISFHTPRIPREVLAAGSCLICSKEIVEKQWFKESLVDGKNYVLIPDPKDISYLANCIKVLLLDKQLTYIIGKHGHMLSRFIEGEYAQSDPIVSLINQYNLK
jgi:glycosyltransferase involved in cell wall biosynthesis